MNASIKFRLEPVAVCGFLFVIAATVACSSSSNQVSTRPDASGGFGGASGGAGGSGGTMVCAPGLQVECACVGGAKGAQACKNDGSGYGTCQCPDPNDGGTAETGSADGRMDGSMDARSVDVLGTDAMDAPVMGNVDSSGAGETGDAGDTSGAGGADGGADAGGGGGGVRDAGGTAGTGGSGSGGTAGAGGGGGTAGAGGGGGTAGAGGSGGVDGGAGGSGVPPVINSFVANPTAVHFGDSAVLTAVFSGGTGSIDHGIGTVTSGVGLSSGPVNANTLYTLTVTSDGGIRGRRR